MTAGGLRTVIGSGTFEAVQQRLERGPVPPMTAPPAPMITPYEPSLIYPTVPPPPPPPPSLMIPPQVRLC